MPRRAKGLSAAGVAKAKPGRYGDGAGLYLLVRESRANANAPEETELQKFWIFRYVRNGRMREMGLGPAAGRTAVTLTDARKAARALYDKVRAGIDPLDERDATKAAQKIEDAKRVTFKDAATKYIAAHRAGWKNDKHAAQWPSTLEAYAYPVIGDLPVQAIDTAHVIKVLEPIWTTKTETAGRLRGRIEAVLDWATAREYRKGENPARWKGHLDNLLAARGKIAKVEHHPALAYDELPDFMAALRKQEGTAARALEFTILTIARTGETIGAKPAEFKSTDKLWTVPPERMKAGREHRVALSKRAVEIVSEMEKGSSGAFVFPGRKPNTSLSNMAMLQLLKRMKRGDLTVHGFRSTFRDWCAERTNYPSEVAEMALAHAVGDKVEAAYRRGDLFEKRRRLAEEWARFCSTVPKAYGNVTALRGKAS